MPLLFAAQQTIDGAIWLLLPGATEPALTAQLASIFAAIALVVWPLWTPLAVVLIEPDKHRRMALVILLAFAAPIALLGLQHLSAAPYDVCIVQNSLFYTNGLSYDPWQLVAYAASTTIPLIISSDRAVRTFGFVVIAGLAASTTLFLATSFSVWCFFAAGGSGIISLRFAEMKRGAKSIVA